MLKPFLLFFLKRDLYGLTPLFLSESESLKKVLRHNRFHPALCAHPSILFGERIKDDAKVGFLRVKVPYLKKCVKIGLLKDNKGHNLMYELGMQPYYGDGVDFWFEESHSPVIPYAVTIAPKPKSKIVVYSVLTGNYDDVHEILYKEEDVDYLLFTNNPSLTSKTWQVILVQSDLDNVLLSREIKMMPHKYLGDMHREGRCTGAPIPEGAGRAHHQRGDTADTAQHKGSLREAPPREVYRRGAGGVCQIDRPLRNRPIHARQGHRRS